MPNDTISLKSFISFSILSSKFILYIFLGPIRYNLFYSSNFLTRIGLVGITVD